MTRRPYVEVFDNIATAAPSLTRNSPEERRAAALRCAENAADRDELRLWLDMLGLTGGDA